MMQRFMAVNYIKYREVIGTCECGCPVYWDDDEEKAVFTCDQYPCWLEGERENED